MGADNFRKFSERIYMYYKQGIGKLGELKAEKYLIRNNYKIIERNFRCNFGEIDIIAKDLKKQEIVFVEVKTRNNKTYGEPSEAVNYYKKKHILKSVKYFMHINKLEKEFIRIDVIEVHLDKGKGYKINHIQQALY